MSSISWLLSRTERIRTSTVSNEQQTIYRLCHPFGSSNGWLTTLLTYPFETSNEWVTTDSDSFVWTSKQMTHLFELLFLHNRTAMDTKVHQQIPPCPLLSNKLQLQSHFCRCHRSASTDSPLTDASGWNTLTWIFAAKLTSWCLGIQFPPHVKHIRLNVWLNLNDYLRLPLASFTSEQVIPKATSWD